MWKAIDRMWVVRVSSVVACLAAVALVCGLGSAFAEDDYLFAGGSYPNVVYEYNGGTTWTPISADLGCPVLCLVEYNGQVYAGTCCGDVYRHDWGTTWTQVGTGLDNQVCALIVFRGDLYAGTAWTCGRLYRYDGGTLWTLVVDYTQQEDDPPTPWNGFRALYVWNDMMHMGDLGYDLFGRWDGTTFYYDADMAGSCIYDFQVYQDEIYACAYYGRVHRSSDGVVWSAIRDYQSSYSWEMETYLGDLYLSTGPTLEIYNGTGFVPVWTEPDGNEIISMMCSPSGLVIGTGEEAGYSATPGIGRVYIYDGATAHLVSDTLGSGVQAFVGAGPFEPSAVSAVTWGEIKALFQK